LNDLVLPKFTDRKAQNVVHFFSDLDSYFNLKCVPESLKLPLAMKAITDGYTRQWFAAIYKDLTNYQHFKRAITELLFSPQMQSRTRCALYQDKYDKSRDESMSSHILKYCVMAAHLSPRMTESDLIDAISVHFSMYVQRAILSANVRTIEEALGFLNKLEILENGEGSRGPIQGHQNNNNSRFNHNGDTNQYRTLYERGRQSEHHVRNFGFRDNQNYNRGRQHDHFGRNYESLAARDHNSMESQSAAPMGPAREGLNPQASTYQPNGPSTHPTNHGENSVHSSTEN